MASKPKVPIKAPTRRRTPQRAIGPFSGIRLRKPAFITLEMLEAWDVCYDGYAWLKLHGGEKGRLELTEKALTDAIRRSHLGTFPLSWLITINDRIFGGLMDQTDLKSARTAINKMRAEFNAQVSAAGLSPNPPEQVALDQKLVLVAKFIDNLAKI